MSKADWQYNRVPRFNKEELAQAKKEHEEADRSLTAWLSAICVNSETLLETLKRYTRAKEATLCAARAHWIAPKTPLPDRFYEQEAEVHTE